jgi:hypothetical protein
MAVEITMDHPDFPKGTEFDLGGVLVPNGKTVKLSDDAELSFVSRHHQAVKDKLGNNEYVKVGGTAKYGPTEVDKMFPAIVWGEEAPPTKAEGGEES